MLRVTPYERVSSGLFASLSALLVVVGALTFVWFTGRIPAAPPAIPVELVEFPGGSEDGSPDETLRVDSPLPETPDASNAEVVADESEVAQSLDNVVAAADEAAAHEVLVQDVLVQSERQVGVGSRNVGKAGSASGTGRRALGFGPGLRGFPREMRWLVRFSEQSNLDEYAKQFDFFGIELGAIVGNKLVYLSNVSAAQPKVRSTNSGAEEKRLYLTWQGGSRKQADLQLFAKAGIDVGSGAILHFYTKSTEDHMARLELDYHKRRADEIRRTFFAVKRTDKGGYDFEVVNQTYLK